jgi:hypothetical protein
VYIRLRTLYYRRMETLNYLVVQARNGRPTVRVVPEGTVILDRFEAWPIDSGKRVLAVNGKLPKALEQFRIGGAFHGVGAVYGLPYDELVMVCKQLMGETEREKYERICAQANEAKRRSGRSKWTALSEVLWAVLSTSLFVFGRVAHMIMVLLLIPIILRWIGKRKGSH